MLNRKKRPNSMIGLGLFLLVHAYFLLLFSRTSWSVPLLNERPSIWKAYFISLVLPCGVFQGLLVSPPMRKFLFSVIWLYMQLFSHLAALIKSLFYHIILLFKFRGKEKAPEIILVNLFVKF